MREAIRVIHKAGIHIHGMFVFGFESDNWSTVEATLRFAQEMKLTSVQLLILTPLPGSQLYETLKAQGRITSCDWSRFDAHHVVYQPAGLTPFELQRAQIYGHARLYNFRELLKRLIAAVCFCGLGALRRQNQPAMATVERRLPQQSRRPSDPTRAVQV